MGISFRALRAEEVECRIGQIARNGNGLSLLLFKTARVDCDILDEVLGCENWQCEYDVINGQLFCKVSIWSEARGQWVSKQDVGSPSNMEAEKGRASDAFKRACFKLGIGRELYTAPRIWVYADKCNIRQGANGKPQCYDSFSVDRIEIRDHTITYVSVRNDSNGQIVFAWAKPEVQVEPQGRNANSPTDEQLAEVNRLIEQLANKRGASTDAVRAGLMETSALKDAGVTNGVLMTQRQAYVAIGQLMAWMDRS